MRWARLLLDRAVSTLRGEFSASGDESMFETLAPFLVRGKGDVSYGEVARQLSVAESAVKTLIHRLRRRFASAVRREVMQTVSAPHEVDDELRQLRVVFTRRGERQVA